MSSMFPMNTMYCSSLDVICFLTDVRWNSAGMLGGRALMSAVKQNSVLCNLELLGNNIPVDIANAISKNR